MAQSRFKINPFNNQNTQSPLMGGNLGFQSQQPQPSQLGTLAQLLKRFNAPFGQQPQMPSFAQKDLQDVTSRLNTPQNPPKTQTLGANNPVPMIPSGGSPTNPQDFQALLDAQNKREQAAQPDYNKMINEATGSQQIDNRLNNAPNDMLNKIFDMMSKNSQSNQVNLVDYLNQSRQQAGIPQLQQQFLQNTGQLNQVNQSLYDALGKIQQTPSLTGFQMGARENALERAANPLIGQLTAQNQTLGTALGIGQQNVGQNLQAAQEQQRLGLSQQQLTQQGALGLAGLTPQFANLPYQNQLLQAQAQQAQAQAGFYKNLYGGLTTQGNNQGELPTLLQGATTKDITGQDYIVESRVPSLGGMGTDLAKSYAGRLGIPILSDAQASSIAALDTTQTNLTDLQSKVGGLLGSGLGGRVQGLTLNNVEKYLGVGKGPALAQIDSFRESAIKQIQGLASGNTGLRLNQAEINSAIQNLPTSQDNIETANAKLQQLGVFFANQRSAIMALGGLKSSAAHMQSTQGSVGWGF